MHRLASVVLSFGLAACGSTAGDTPLPQIESAPRRLTRYEYDNTVRDLLDTTLRPAQDFPATPRGLGFDNITSLQTTSVDEQLRFELAAQALAAQSHDICGTLECLIHDFAPKAWRRPLQPSEQTGLHTLYSTLVGSGESDAEARAGILEAILLSPAFLYRVELDPHYAMASRLSYFLWSSMPDDALFEAAEHEDLHDPAAVDAQVERMLDDGRAHALVESFAGQWLHFRALDDIFKDHVRYPNFDDELRNAMRRELDDFFASFIRDDRDFRELLTAETTVVDPRVAGLYGVAADPEGGLVSLDLHERPRRGLMTMPGMMALLARPFRTAPVKRGSWVLSQLMCAPPPPPPDGVEAFAEGVDTTTVRTMLEQHREDPACAGCHDLIDPIGLAFEHYDALGRWRSDDDGEPIETAGTLPDGSEFADALELSSAIAESDAFVACAARQVMTYALGRELESEDEDQLEGLVESWADTGYRTRALFRLVANSAAFREAR